MTGTVEPGDAEAKRAPDKVRRRIVAAAADILARHGRDAVTTRAVAAAAGVQAPTLYRLLGDKGGLLDAVAEYGFAEYLKLKDGGDPDPDPIEALRRGWDRHIAFGLTHPAIYALMYAEPRAGLRSPAAATADRFLRARMQALAATGQLRVGQELAADLVHAAACGTVLTLLAMPEDRRNSGLSSAAREAVIAAVVSSPSPALADPRPAAVANALRVALPDAAPLTAAERHLLVEWLDRLVADRPSKTATPSGR